jgi:DNA-binding FrmR family transcriptional regulator
MAGKNQPTLDELHADADGIVARLRALDGAPDTDDVRRQLRAVRGALLRTKTTLGSLESTVSEVVKR